MADETAAPRSQDSPAGGARSQATPETVFGHGAPTNMPAQLGRYRIKRRLGGGMGAVYLVENTELQREEALKVPHFESGNDPAVRERFLREARAAAKLHHPNLCPIYHADVIDGIYFLTMCYAEPRPRRLVQRVHCRSPFKELWRKPMEGDVNAKPQAMALRTKRGLATVMPSLPCGSPSLAVSRSLPVT
jgi:hypothetical protein